MPPRLGGTPGNNNPMGAEGGCFKELVSQRVPWVFLGCS